jgi:hypothetical protein
VIGDLEMNIKTLAFDDSSKTQYVVDNGNIEKTKPEHDAQSTGMERRNGDGSMSMKRRNQ